MTFGGAPGNAVSPSVISAVETVRSVAAKVITYVLNDGNLGAIDQIFGRGFIDHNKLNGQQDGIEGMKQFVDRFKSAFPDSTVTPDVSLAENDKAAVRWTATGTHRGMFLGIPPTGKKIKFSSIHLFRIAQNQVVEKWGYWPVAETLQQLSGAGPQQ